ncbi:MAG: YchJ family protein [Candidatus Sulfobium sp.]
MDDVCPCGSGMPFADCCGPVIEGQRHALTAEQLMRSRYSAYVKGRIEYLRTSLHPDHRQDFDEKNTREWAESSEWHGMEIVETKYGGPEDAEGKVEFIVSFTQNGKRMTHHELGSFSKVDGTWYFQSGEAVSPKPVVRTAPKTGRNEPCPCGSGLKFKKCCGK